MAKAHLKLVTPATVKRTVTPRRPSNAMLRTREYLTEAEVQRLMAAAKGNRWGHRGNGSSQPCLLYTSDAADE